MVKLSWYILACKYAYYCSPKGVKCPSDEVYDKLEDEYRILCEKLSEPASAADMVGFDEDRPSCRLVKGRVDSMKKIPEITCK